jgi:DNA-binding LacI/PurR family transcriptional regulator
VQEYTTTMGPRGLWNESKEGRSPDSKKIMQIAHGFERSAQTAQDIRQHDIWRELYRALPGAVQSAANYRAFVPLGEMALADGGYTAFVGANDTAALQCLSFLREKGFSSRQISVIGFDNTNDSAWNNITSFDFGVVAAIHRSIDFILRPLSHKRNVRGVHEVQVHGHIVDRGSVWRVG